MRFIYKRKRFWRFPSNFEKIRVLKNFQDFPILTKIWKIFIFYWFYKVFWRSQNALRKRCVGNAFLMTSDPFFDFDTQKASFSIGFIRYFDMVKCYLVYSEKGNAFWRFWHLKGLPIGDLEPPAFCKTTGFFKILVPLVTNLLLFANRPNW